jgi:hypothetical protein
LELLHLESDKDQHKRDYRRRACRKDDVSSIAQGQQREHYKKDHADYSVNPQYRRSFHGSSATPIFPFIAEAVADSFGSQFCAFDARRREQRRRELKKTIRALDFLSSWSANSIHFQFLPITRACREE